MGETGDLQERVLEGEVLYEGKIIKLERLKVSLPSGEQSIREVVVHQGAVSVVAVTGEGRVILVRQFRLAAGCELLELPAGRLEPGEDPLACARREVLEETGFRGGVWEELGWFYTTPGFCTERMHLFLARDLSPGPSRPEWDEFVTVEFMESQEALRRARAGGFRDAKTVAGLLLAGDRL